MRRSLVAPVLVATLAFLAACSDREPTVPRPITPRPTASTATLPLSCDFATMNNDAKKYFPARDGIFTIITSMKNAYKNGGATAATPFGLDALARTAAVRNSSIEIGTGAQGGTFVLDVVVCMSIGTIPSTFEPGLALTSGIFEVISADATSPTPLLGKAAGPGTTTVITSPKWGVELRTGGAWPPVQTYAGGTRYLVYAYPLGTDVAASGYELATLPTTVNIGSNPLNTGICVPSTILVGGQTAQRLIVHAGSDILNIVRLGFCSSTGSTMPTSWVAALTQRVGSFFAPKPLGAQGDFFGGVGGLPSGWSPININSYITTNVGLTFSTQPSNTNDCPATTPIAVQATWTGAPLSGPLPITVVLTIAGNNGTPAFLTDNCGPSVSSVTKSTTINPTTNTGTANFVIGYTKAGGYTLTATGHIGGGAATPGVTSVLFQVKNK